MLTRYACYLIAQNGDPRKPAIATKNLATEMTNHNVTQEQLHGETSITREHEQNNRSVRDMLGQRDIQPEQLPAEEESGYLPYPDYG